MRMGTLGKGTTGGILLGGVPFGRGSFNGGVPTTGGQEDTP